MADDSQVTNVLMATKNAAKSTKHISKVAHQLWPRKGANSGAECRVSNYRSRRRAKIGGPVVSLESGIIQHRSFTDAKFVLIFILYAGLMVSVIKVYNALVKSHFHISKNGIACLIRGAQDSNGLTNFDCIWLQNNDRTD